MTRLERWRTMTDEEIMYLVMNPEALGSHSAEFCHDCKLTDEELDSMIESGDDKLCRECAIKWLREED